MLRCAALITLLPAVYGWGYCNDKDVSCGKWSQLGECDGKNGERIDGFSALSSSSDTSIVHPKCYTKFPQFPGISAVPINDILARGECMLSAQGWMALAVTCYNRNPKNTYQMGENQIIFINSIKSKTTLFKSSFTISPSSSTGSPSTFA